jgi:hypothetical protein
MIAMIFLTSRFFLASFRPSPKHPRHTCGPFAAHRLEIAALDHVVLNGREKDLEGSDLDLVEVLPQNFPRGSEGSHWKLQSRLRFESRTPEKESTILPLCKSAWGTMCINMA